MKQFSANKRIPVPDHPPYSPELAPCDFCLIPKLIGASQASHFYYVDDVKAKTA